MTISRHYHRARKLERPTVLSKFALIRDGGITFLDCELLKLTPTLGGMQAVDPLTELVILDESGRMYKRRKRTDV